jgi:hypothetical protein
MKNQTDIAGCDIVWYFRRMPPFERNMVLLSLGSEGQDAVGLCRQGNNKCACLVPGLEERAPCGLIGKSAHPAMVYALSDFGLHIPVPVQHTVGGSTCI